MAKKKSSTEKKADPKYPPDHEPDEFDPDDEDTWPDVKEEDADRRA